MARREPRNRCRIGIDVGGTFTDFVLANMATGEMTRYKEPSVPTDPSMSVRRGLPPLIERAGVMAVDVELIVHGTTLLVNAIIQGRGAKVGLLVSKGHRGVLEIGRARLANTYDFRVQKEKPLVTRDLIFETSARILADGTVIGQPKEGEFVDIAGKLKEKEVDAVTVLLLHSYAHPEMERHVAAELRKELPGIPVTESAHVWPERREFERSQVAIMNGFVQPLMDDYLRLLVERVHEVGIEAPIYITASNGGTLSIETARTRPIYTILSGPASDGFRCRGGQPSRGGPRRATGSTTARRQNVITVDMGGTSCDMAVTKGAEPEYSTRTHVGDYPLVLPVINVSSIGAGGGSIVWVDPQGVLKVGPRSRRCRPRTDVLRARQGTEPTVTDCYLLVGYIDPEHFLGGRMKLDAAAARAALEAIADKAGIAGEDRAVMVAVAALRLTTAVMSTELLKDLAQRGEDHRDFALMAYGGAGPTHANLLAEEAQLRAIVIPPAPATFCAMGAILADVKRDYVRSRHLKFDDGQRAVSELADLFRKLEQEASAWVETEGELLGEPEFAATVDMRYKGQAFDVQVIIPDALRVEPDAEGIAELFHQEHEKIYGFRDLESGVEVTTERVRVTARVPPITLKEVAAQAGAQPTAERRVFHEESYLAAPVFLRRELGRDETISGPAIIEQVDSTTWILPGWTATVDRIGNLLISPAT